MSYLTRYKKVLAQPSVGRRFARYIVLFSLLVTLILTITQLWLDYQYDVKALENQLVHIEESNAQSLAKSLWSTNKTDIQLQLADIARLPDIQYVEVHSAQGELVASVGKREYRHVVSRETKLFYTYRGQQIHVGRLLVVGTLHNIYQQVADLIVTILLMQAAQAFLISLFTLFLFYQLVGRNLYKIAQFAEQLETHSAAKTLKLDRQQDTQHNNDELDLLVHALNSMNQRISSNYSDLQESEYRWKHALEGPGDGIWDWNLEIDDVYFSHQYMRLLGYEHDEKWTTLAEWKSHCHPDDLPIMTAAFEAHLNGKTELFSCEHRMQNKDGSWKWLLARGRVVHRNSSDNQPSRMIGSSADITERKLHEAQIDFLVNNDPLTGLPNRILAKDRFIQAMAFAERLESKVALIFLDLDNFKSINDTLGHTAGDKLLKVVSLKLQECVREADTVSRQGGDEFVIILSNIRANDNIGLVVNKILAQITLPISIDGQELSISTSLGIAIYPDDGDDFDTLMKKADVAMYKAKEAGKNTACYYTYKMNADAYERLSIRNGLQKALSSNELVLHYQPQINLTSGNVIGAEALLRWMHPEHGMIAPSRFIAIAEESGLIVPIGDWVLQEACRQIGRWQQAGWTDCVIAVNLSAVQFKRGNLELCILNAINEAKIDPASLELELTESILIQDTDYVLAILQKLKALGVYLSIDDFGTGYSSLSYLKRFAVDKLKIDQSFIREMQHNPNDAAIVKAIIQMACSLNLKTIAEGVETGSMAILLHELHCDEAQGYFFARPMPADEFFSYLQRTNQPDNRQLSI